MLHNSFDLNRITLQKSGRFPLDIFDRAAKHFHWVERDKLSSMVRGFVSLNNEKEYIIFDLIHELYEYLRRNIEINRVKYRNKYDAGRFD